MSRAAKHTRKHLPINVGVPWMVWGLFIGWLVGTVDEIVEGLYMFRMIAGGIVGLAVGALADFIRDRLRKQSIKKSEQKRRGKTP